MTKEGDETRGRIVAFMLDYQREHRRGPTIEEVARKIGVRGIGYHFTSLSEQRLVLKQAQESGVRGASERPWIACPQPVPFGATSVDIGAHGEYIFYLE